MKVKLIAASTGETENLLEFIAYVARVSNPSNQHNNDTAPGLVRYLIKHKHWSPFEMANIILEINTTRDMARQILRHRSFSFQEFSQRYADASQLGWSERECRMQDTKNRQNSTIADNPALEAFWETRTKDFLKSVEEQYTWALDNGIAKEQARAFLPEGFTNTRMYVNGTVRSWIHYLEVRTDPGTQKEHREIAVACAKAIEPVFPMIMEFISNEKN